MDELTNSDAQSTGRPSLRGFLQTAAPGRQVIAYLTIGDPAEGFADVAQALLTAGALTLELGIPHPDPREGPTLAASHRRALAAGVTTDSAISLLGDVARRSPSYPVVAVVQWAAIGAPADRATLLGGLSDAGAAAVLPIGVPLNQLAGTAVAIQQFGMETVLSCYVDTPAPIRRLALRHCSGCVYVPRSRGQTGAAVPTPHAELEEFCEQLARETQLPLVVGFGVDTGADVAEICASRAVAAAVGSALVKHLAAGDPPGDFIRQLLGRSLFYVV